MNVSNMVADFFTFKDTHFIATNFSRLMQIKYIYFNLSAKKKVIYNAPMKHLLIDTIFLFPLLKVRVVQKLLFQQWLLLGILN